ncbi:MAG TPA: PxKF domain-containing protein [Pedococcus sp.]|nr:PxKF domain-containing protein [Pedococcus sp.]
MTALFLMASSAFALADNIESDSDVLDAGVQSNTININLAAGGSTSVAVGVQVISSGGVHASFPVAVTASTTNVTGTPLGAPSPTSLSVTAYGDAGQDETSIPVTAPAAGSLTCGVNNQLVGRVTFTTSASGFQGNNNTDTVQINVNVPGPPCAPSNSAPVINRDNGSVAVDEGATATNTGTWSDADAGDTVTLSASVGTVIKSGTNAGGTWSWSFNTTDGPDDSQTVTITADDGTTTSSTTFALVVNNVKPTPSIDSLTGAGGTACIGGNTVTLGFSWTDPAGANDTYDYSVNWGDGSTTPASGSSAATSPVTGLQHTYAAGGPYTIKVTVNDNDTGAGTTVDSSSFSFLYDVTGVLQPVNDTQAHQDPSIFKWGSTIPVKIRVTDCNGTSVAGLSPTITVTKVNPNPPPDGYAETTQSTSAADTGNTMRYDALAGQYIYNLATKPLTDGTATYTIKITGPFSTVYANFGLKTK